MLGLIARRMAAAVLVMVAVAAITFSMLHVLRPEAFFDPRPLGTQLLDYLRDVFLHLDLGRTRDPPFTPIANLVREGFWASFQLLAGACVIGVGLGVAAGTLAASRRGTWVDRLIEVGAMVALCSPVYWVGLMLQVFFAPVGGQFDVPIDIRSGNYAPFSDDPKQWFDGLIVPWLVLAGPLAGMCERMMRASAVDALQQDFIRTATAKGLSHRAVLRRHVVPAGASPTVSLAGANMPLMVTNLVLVEVIFNVPGVFRFTMAAMADGEFEILQALVIVGALLVVIGNLVVDVVLAWLDPRVRSSS